MTATDHDDPTIRRRERLVDVLEALADLAPDEDPTIPLAWLDADDLGKWVEVFHPDRNIIIGPVTRLQHWTTMTGTLETMLVADPAVSSGGSWPVDTQCEVHDTDPRSAPTPPQ